VRGDGSPEAHPASCTMGTGSFPWVKRPECGADHPFPCSAGLWIGWSHTSACLLCLHRHVMGWPFRENDGVKMYFWSGMWGSRSPKASYLLVTDVLKCIWLSKHGFFRVCPNATLVVSYVASYLFLVYNLTYVSFTISSVCSVPVISSFGMLSCTVTSRYEKSHMYRLCCLSLFP
jgi:hypothetical protein